MDLQTPTSPAHPLMSDSSWKSAPTKSNLEIQDGSHSYSTSSKPKKISTGDSSFDPFRVADGPRKKA